MKYGSFVADTRTQDAVIRNLEIPGEATKNLSDALRAQYPTQHPSRGAHETAHSHR